MKTLLLIALLFTPMAFAQEARIPLPTCENGRLQYQGQNHFYADICINGIAIPNPKECREYQQKADLKLLREEMLGFMEKRKAKVCGK